MLKFSLIFSLATVFSLATTAQALEPYEIGVVANRFVSGSIDVAHYFMEKRGIPKEHLIVIDTTNKETCSREVFNNEIADPIRKFLRAIKGRGEIRCLVTVYGVPLRVDPPELTQDEQKESAKLQLERKGLIEILNKFQGSHVEESQLLQRQIEVLDDNIKRIDKKDQGAAVDSELSLILANGYPLAGWVMSPYFIGFQKTDLPVHKEDVLMVSRLDGPSSEIVQRMIDDGLAGEQHGLHGVAYFDARWQKPKSTTELEGLAFYDNSLHLAADLIKTRGMLRVTVDDRPELLQPGEAPDAALYCGWYSLGRYVDAFDWRRGAVGYHIASSECVTLRPGPEQGWCKRLLEDGVAATLGPVAEPYLRAFPPPEIFFGILSDGYYSLVEAYFLSLPYLSWQMVLLGDPLYKPFKSPELGRKRL